MLVIVIVFMEQETRRETQIYHPQMMAHFLNFIQRKMHSKYILDTLMAKNHNCCLVLVMRYFT